MCGTFWCEYWGVSVCCVWDILEQRWGIECAAGGLVVCVCVIGCAACGEFESDLGD